MRREHFAIQFLWATIQLLIMCVSLIYLVDEFFIFSFLVLLMELFSSDILRAIISYWAESRYPVKHPRGSSSGNITNGFNTLTISAEKLHRRCSTGLRMCLRLKVLLMWSVRGLQVYGICCRSEVAEARSNRKKSYLR